MLVLMVANVIQRVATIVAQMHFDQITKKIQKVIVHVNKILY
jgi:hypothetical protein